MHRYFPHTQADIDAMLAACGMTDAGQLSADVPEAIRFSGDYDLPQSMSETEIREFFAALAAKNQPLACFAGAGVYDHYTPAVAQNIIQRSKIKLPYSLLFISAPPLLLLQTGLSAHGCSSR